MVAPQYVKPFAKGNKNDYNDTETIAKASQRASMRFVLLKSIKHVQSIHRQREQLKKARTALANQIKGLLAEYGLVIRQSVTEVRRDLPLILEDTENYLLACSMSYVRWINGLVVV